MTICNTTRCPFCDENHFCTNLFTIINDRGLCTQIWDSNGRVLNTAYTPVDDIYKRKITFVSTQKPKAKKSSESIFHQITMEEYLANKES